MRVLLTSVPLVGHFFPMVPLARALRDRGDEILVATPAEDFATTVTGAGLPVEIVRAGLDADAYARASAVDGSGEFLGTAIAQSGRAWGELAARVLESMAELVDDFEPDVVISEPCEFAGRLAASDRGVPWVEHSWAFPGLPEYAVAAATVLPALPSPLVTIHPCPPSLTKDPSAMGMRYVPYNGPARPQPWQEVARGRPRALVTFGSLLLKRSVDAPELVTSLVTSLTRAGFELVLGLDEGLAGRLRPWPSGVLHAGWVSLNLALPHCDLVIHHGGSGTAMAALVAGLPQLTIPQATDQFDTSQILAESGAALRLMPEQASAERVAEYAMRLIEELSFVNRAWDLADEIAALPGPDLVADMLHTRL